MHGFLTRHFFFALLAFLVSVSLAHADTTITTAPTNGLVGYWNFEEGTSTRATDATRYKNNGTLTNGPTWVSGRVGKGLYLDGVDDYVSIGSPASLDNLPALTMSAWVNIPVGGTAHIEKEVSGDNGWYLSASHGGTVSFMADCTIGNVLISFNSPIRATKWHHLTLTWNGVMSDSGVHLYVDGREVAVGNSDSCGVRANDASSPLNIGYYDGSLLYYKSTIDEVRIYNRILSPAEIKQLYQNEAGSTVGFICGKDTVKDADNNVYNTLKIGQQCWMKQNLRVGTRINVAGNQTNNATIEKYCYSNTDSNCTGNNPNQPDGGLYQWNEAMQYSTLPKARGICPAGWHIPTHDEFTTLERAVCTSGSCATDFPYDTSTMGLRGTNEGTKLKPNGTSDWGGNLAGYSSAGSFFNRTVSGYFWLPTESGGDAWSRYLSSGGAQVNRDPYVKSLGLSVRCLKN